MSREPKPPADAVRDYVGVRQGIELGANEAAKMARELGAYAAATESLRATLVPSDQPANFRRALAIGGTARDEEHS